MARPAIETLIKVLLSSGPPHLQDPYPEPSDHNKPHQRLQAARGKSVPSGPGDPHPQGRALDIILFASDGYDKSIADQLVEAFLDERTTMKWGGPIYNKQEWNSAGAWMPRVLTPEVRKKILAKRKAQGNNSEVIDKVAYEHVTHIHIEWGDASADQTGFASSLSDRLKTVVDLGF
jgi:hypothetical protein